MLVEESMERKVGGTAAPHSKELLSLAYIETICATTGLNYDSPKIDNDGIDITVRGKGFSGIFSEPKIEIQLKCTSKIENVNMERGELSFVLEDKNYNYLVGPSPLPLLLVVHLAPKTPEEWVQHSMLGTTLRYASYWYSLYGLEKITQGSKTIKIPLKQQLDRESLLILMNKASKGENIYNLEDQSDAK